MAALAAPVSPSVLALGQDAAPVAAHMGFRAGPVGDSASKEALARLTRQTQTLGNSAQARLLEQAIGAVRKHDYERAAKLALKALSTDDKLGVAWHVLGVSREKLGDFSGSMQCYEAALRLLPSEDAVAGDLGRLAYRMDMPEIAAKLFRIHVKAQPHDVAGVNNLACALRDLNANSEAIDILRPAIQEHPQQPILWNTLGTVMCSLGDGATAVTFFDEALRLNPDFGKGYHNRAYARLDLGDAEGALDDCDKGIACSDSREDIATMQFARSTILLALGRVEEGWSAYEARLSPDLGDAPRFVIEAQPWRIGEPLDGKRLLVVAEQGLGDEVMFANLLPDLKERLGADGSMGLVVERRLKTLFERSFPGVEVSQHRTVAYEGRTYRSAPNVAEVSRYDAWTPIASLLPVLRPTAQAFPERERFLEPDPERVAHWRKVLEDAPAGLKVGLLWKSLKLDGERARQFSPFQLWEPVLKTPGVSFINIQYGDCAEEIAYARDMLGVEVWQPPGIDLKEDLDEVAALTCALDLTIGFSNATINLAGACGAPIWMITAAKAWTRLGTDHYPWYPQAKTFVAKNFAEWPEIMARIATALADRAKA
ncbi:tetratricopeptide repeat protein [Caulobacter hibisci]|uniref:Tetratricopeptide repeat protein n=1 Tax=Caulobacter hibisci TaxID=2035993 RepID=A0ABS0SZB3_9CAUL|nr:tetratricopeptide repeat protein [Caulobacter hibisci]